MSGQLTEPLLQDARVSTLPADIGERSMPTLAETWLEQGREQGLEQGALVHARRTLRPDKNSVTGD